VVVISALPLDAGDMLVPLFFVVMLLFALPLDAAVCRGDGVALAYLLLTRQAAESMVLSTQTE